VTKFRQAVILCGGAGSRLTQKGIFTPKCLLEVDGKTILERQIKVLENSGVEEILLLLGNGSDAIIESVKRWKKNYKLRIETNVESFPLGTAGALFNALDLLEEKFIFIYGDLLLDADFTENFAEFDARSPSVGVLYRSSDHMFDSYLLRIDEKNNVIKFELKNVPRVKPKRNRANVGIYLLKKDLLGNSLRPKKIFDFDREFLPMALENGELILALKFRGYVRDIGTVERLDHSRNEFGTYLEKKGKQSTVLLDRDGVINRQNGYVRSVDDFELLPGATDALKVIFDKGYRILVITNQPVVARGESTWEDVEACHAIIDNELAKIGAFITDYYVCLHHPDKGFLGEREELKINCLCRKPQIGNFTQAIKDYPFAKSDAVYVGDTLVDLFAAKNFGIKFAGIKSQNLSQEFAGHDLYEHLLDFAEKLIDKNGSS
jgi:mannose-1-phosphate guanylyltransferase/phosphomannomutase